MHLIWWERVTPDGLQDDYAVAVLSEAQKQQVTKLMTAKVQAGVVRSWSFEPLGSVQMDFAALAARLRTV